MESSEHVAIGNTIKLDLGNGTTISAAQQPLFPNDPLHLNYGDVVALGGDFYGQPADKGDEPVPISDSPDEASGETAFLAAYGTLLFAVQNPGKPEGQELAKIVEIIGEEQTMIDHRPTGRPPSWAYKHQIGDSLSLKWNEATGGAPAADGKISAWKHPGRYLLLAYRNMDHFAGDAYFAYTVGHNAAMKAATKLQGTLGTTQGQQGLLACYAMNAFADHFLTDLFSAGHLRTPRRPLYNMTTTKSYTSGQCARVMHDEDCSNGIQVIDNDEGTTSWMAYGDAFERDPCNADNWAQANRAVQASATEIIHAATTGDISSSAAALQLTPSPKPFVARPDGTGAAVTVALFEPGGKTPIGWLGELGVGPKGWCVVVPDEGSALQVKPYVYNGSLYFTRASDPTPTYYVAPANDDCLYVYDSGGKTAWTLNDDETEMTSSFRGYSLSHQAGANPDYVWAYQASGYTPLSVEFHDPAGKRDPQASATPITDYVQQASALPNYAPLFWADGDGHDQDSGYVYRRGGVFGDWTDIHDYSYTYSGWSANAMAAKTLAWPNA